MSSRRHLLIKMRGKDPDPCKTGDTKSWFYFYKWNVSGEAFFPVKEEPEVTSGDMVWFCLDGVVLGCALIHRVQYDPMNQVYELCYVGEAVHRLIKPIRLKGAWDKGFVPTKQAERWRAKCRDLFTQEQASPKKPDSLIVRAPSQEELQLLVLLRTHPEKMCLMPVMCDGENCLALAVLVNKEGEDVPLPVAVLVDSNESIHDALGQKLAPLTQSDQPQNKGLTN